MTGSDEESSQACGWRLMSEILTHSTHSGIG